MGLRAPRPLNILFVMGWLGHVRFYLSSLELLLDRGHNVQLLIEKGGWSPAEQRWLDEAGKRPNFGWEHARNYERDPWHRRSLDLRRGLAHIHFFGPAFRSRPRYRRRALRSGSPTSIRRIAALPVVRSARGLRLLYGTVSAAERSMPLPKPVDDCLARYRPDVVVLGNYNQRDSHFASFVRLARKDGIPVVALVASWDNLSTRPPMTALPHRLVVWNETQLREAVELQRIPIDDVVVTGAPNFDHWFGWRPRSRGEFLGAVGLDPAKPVVLWAAGALLPWEPSEAEYVRTWVEALRSSDDPVLREAGILLRPHPKSIKEWQAVDYSGFENVAMWPRDQMSMPIESDQRADYFDSIYHSKAVVGIMTSAMIEAAIVGRPVLTFLEPDYHDSQLGADHYAYLLESSGGAVQLATSFDDHLAELSAALVRPEDDASEAARRFVAHFVRPHGFDEPATPRVVEAIEQTADLSVEPETDPIWVASLRKAIVFGSLVVTPRRVKRVRHYRKQSRKFVRRVRRSARAGLAIRQA